MRIQFGLSINTLRGVLVALFLTISSSLRSSYPVKTKASENAYIHDVCPHPFHRVRKPGLVREQMQRYEEIS